MSNMFTERKPIAIVGMACRFPGGVESPEDLWRLVTDETCVSEPLPRDRGWDPEQLFDSDRGAGGKTYVRSGAFLTDVAGFDADFFGISPREALGMDPQQRLLLECAWEACERARLDPRVLRGTRTGVYVGATESGYAAWAERGGTEADGYLVTGSTLSVAAGRIAYVLGLTGPTLTVDTACSSSLAALHLAVRALRAGECSMALAAGVTVGAGPQYLLEFSRQQALAADGRSKAFAADADGFALAEGVGTLLLATPLEAERLGLPVLAMVRGSALNEDGASQALTVPSGPSQREVIALALADSGLVSADVDAVEAHGTGTAVGDPIEASSIAATYGAGRPVDHPVWVGSVKSNIGHSLAASGVAGVIKMVMAMRHGILPRTLHAADPHSGVDWTAGGMRLLNEQRPWPRTGRPRRVGVLGYGISGTNAHVILEGVPSAPGRPQPRSGVEADPGVWLLSADGPEALREQARRLASAVRGSPSPNARSLGRSLITTRTSFDHRAAVVGTDPESFLAALDVLGRGERDPRVVTGVRRDEPGAVFVFPGQGAQWPGMAHELLATSPVFARSMQECAEALGEFVECDFMKVARDMDVPERVDLLQPLLFAVSVSLAKLWQSYGVSPAAVIGHSQGEIAAAHVAGALSLSDAARVAALRSRALVAIAGEGGMVSCTGSGVDALRRYAARWGGQLEVAAVNGPGSVVLAGGRDAIEELLAQAEADGIEARRVNVDYASHSSAVEAVRGRILADLAALRPHAPETPFLSATTGNDIGDALLDADYWYRNLRQTVRFDETIGAALAAGHRLFLEISPHPLLAPGIHETVDGAAGDATVLTTLRRDDGGMPRFLTALAEAHCHGVRADWSWATSGGEDTDLPTYAFQHKRFWLTPPKKAATAATAGLRTVEHPFLELEIDTAQDGGRILTGRLSLHAHPWLADHAVKGSVILPGTAVMELALQAAQQIGHAQVSDLTLLTPIVLHPTQDLLLQIVVGPADTAGQRTATVYTRGADAPADLAWDRHAQWILAPGGESAPETTAPWPPHDAEPVALDGFYERLEAVGYEYGPVFRGLRALWRHGDHLYAEVRLPEEQHDTAHRFALHPALLDAAMHPLLLNLRDPQRVELPFSVGRLHLYASGATELRARISASAGGPASVTVTDTAGKTVASLKDLTLRPVGEQRLSRRDNAFTQVWRPLPLPAQAAVRSRPDVDVLEVPVLPTLTERLFAVLVGVRTHLADGSSPVVITRQAVAVQEGEDIGDLGAAAVWGLVRTAQSEHPGHITLVDLDDTEASQEALHLALASGEPQIALRKGLAFVPRLATLDPAALLTPPPGATSWQLAPGEGNTLESLRLREAPEAAVPLSPEQVRVDVRAAGLNFRDVLVALGVVDPGASLGREAAGVVTEVGSAVDSCVPGDRVMVLLVGRDRTASAFGPVVVADHRAVSPIPDGWTFTQAAGASVAFATASYVFEFLAALKPGQRVLIHAATGGLGMAAVQLAKHLGAEVFATASPAKWDTLQSMGIPLDHIASSRTLEFEQAFLTATDGQGMDTVLNSLSGEFIDASLRLLPRGGHFIEMGVTDLRDATDVAFRHPGVNYLASDLLDIRLDELRTVLGRLTEHFRAGDLTPLPTRVWDLPHARSAFQTLSQARHTGKLVLTIPRTIDPNGTVLITGGTGRLGSLLARHLVATHQARHLLLTSRQGGKAPGAPALAQELSAEGATVDIVSCDAADRDALAAVLATVPAEHPLTAVIHTAGALDDAVFQSLTSRQLDRALRPKAIAVNHLHELTQDADLAAFVLYSSASTAIGQAGQAGYAAANAYLDALAHHRRARGLPAISIAWGLWADSSAMTSHMFTKDSSTDRASRTVYRPLSADDGLALFDTALAVQSPYLLAASFKQQTLQAQAEEGSLAPLLRDLTRAPAVRRTTEEKDLSWPQRVRDLPHEERLEELTTLVRALAADVLGHPDLQDIPSGRSFRDSGFDSLSSVELRTLLANTTGLRLAPSAVFEYPDPLALARHLEEQLASEQGTATTPPTQDQEDTVLITEFTTAVESGDTETGMRLLRAAARLRPTFTTPEPSDLTPPDQLSHGTQAPALVCLPSLPSTPQRPEYAQLAAHLGNHEMWSLHYPGYHPGQGLPESLTTLLDILVDATAQITAKNKPFVLLGHSSGGWIAHTLAQRLEEHRHPASGLILLDTIPAADTRHEIYEASAGRLAQAVAGGFYGTAALTATAAYVQLMAHWTPTPIDTPTLYLRATPSLSWPVPHTLRQATGDHFTMITQYASHQADTIQQWLPTTVL
ncbi:SDR family NAD(P)-dependent oxidoreductase [Kitasatospora sp. NPDC088548]|uniref:SDR family NAD(P)-dependent oxidoreductase n=1 Tax=Kitasatospora sp. NPDC088548 TaxID=3364075 RepID=UPI00381C44E9